MFTQDVLNSPFAFCRQQLAGSTHQHSNPTFYNIHRKQMSKSYLSQNPKCLSPPTPEQSETHWPAHPSKAASVSKYSLQIPQEPHERLLKHKTTPATFLVSQLEQQVCLRKLSPSRNKSHQGEIAHGPSSTLLTLQRLDSQGLGTQGK